MSEFGDYKWYQLIYLFFCAFVQAAGIYIISNKPKWFSIKVDKIRLSKNKKNDVIETDDSSTEVTLDSEIDQ